MSGEVDKETQCELMKGKRIIAVGGGSYRLRDIWQDAAKLGIKVILVEADPQHIAKDCVHHFIHYDFSDHTIDVEHACKIVSLIHGCGLKADGCLSFWDECVPLAALVNEKLGTRGPSYKATMTANSKTSTQNVLSMQREDISDCPRTDVYSSKSVHLRTEFDCDTLPDGFKFPAILKLDNGGIAVGTCVVQNRAEMKKQFCQITSSLRTDSDVPGIGLGHGNSMTTMEFYSGTEHNVDVIIYKSKLIGAFITDCATAKRMPSFLSEELQKQLIEAAFRCCIQLGLSDGTFNADFMMTENGPKLLEINPRMGGYCLRDWLRKLYGIDYMHYSMMIACGVTPYVPIYPPADTILMGIMVIPSLHAKILKEEHFKNLLYDMVEKEEIVFLQFSQLFENSSNYEIPFGNIGVSGSTSEEAKRKLMNVCRMFDIDQDNYPVEQFIRHF